MTSVLAIYPGHGSVWLEDAYLDDEGWVVGKVWDEDGVGSAYMPDDYRGEYTPLGFPQSCILKVENGPLVRKP